MLKLFMCILLVVTFGIMGVSQTTDQKVEDFLGSNRYQELSLSNPGLISFLKTKVEEGFRVSDSKEIKKSSFKKIRHVFYKKNEISIEEFISALGDENFNILNYSFPEHHSAKTTHYLLGESKIVLTIYSNTIINNRVAAER